MKKIILSAMFVVFIILVNNAYASTITIARVTDAGIFGNGRLYVKLDTTINEPSCPNARFDVDPSNPNIKFWLSIAMAALSTGKQIRVSTNGCYGTFPTLGVDTATWLDLLK